MIQQRVLGDRVFVLVWVDIAAVMTHGYRYQREHVRSVSRDPALTAREGMLKHLAANPEGASFN
jgi:hypothetical protein